MSNGIRYDNRMVVINASDLYKPILKGRKLKTIRQYNSPNIKYPTLEQISELTVIDHVWKQGDRLYKIADEFYGDPELWWIIAMFNQKPTEAFVGQGTLIYIPTPLDIVISYFTVDEEDE